jgi:hypothetical protein
MARTDTMAGRPQLSFEAYADRATMAVGPDGEYVCVWEQFDSLNADPDGELRCDIVASVSTDNGVTWSDPCRFAHGGTVSRRYPCVARNILHGDSLAVVYLSDLQAGCSVPVGSPPQAVGSPTKNPFICQRVPIPGLVGVAESRKTYPPASYLCQATPSVFRGRTKISYSLPRAGDVKLRVFDAVGRPVKTLVNANVAAGRYTTTWDGRTDKGLSASAGIYFYTLSTSKTSISKKLTLLP